MIILFASVKKINYYLDVYNILSYFLYQKPSLLFILFFLLFSPSHFIFYVLDLFSLLILLCTYLILIYIILFLIFKVILFLSFFVKFIICYHNLFFSDLFDILNLYFIIVVVTINIRLPQICPHILLYIYLLFVFVNLNCYLVLNFLDSDF